MPTPFVQLKLDESAGPTAKDTRATTPLRTINGARTVLETGSANYNPSVMLAPNGDRIAFLCKGNTVNASNSRLFLKRCLAAADPMNPLNWSAAQLVADHLADTPIPQIFGVGCAVALTTGELVCSYNTFDSSHDTMDGQTHDRVYIRRSLDNGATWSSPYRITQSIHHFGIEGVSLYNPPFELPDGSLLLPLYYADTWEDLAAGLTDPNRWYVNLVKSTDKGLTWSFFCTAVPPVTSILWTESQLIRVVDGRLLLLVRSYSKIEGGVDKSTFGVWSSDEGATWTTPPVRFYCRGWNNPGAHQFLVPGVGGTVNTIAIAIRDAVQADTQNATPPIYLESSDGGVRWGQRVRLNVTNLIGQVGGGCIPAGAAGAGEILVVDSEGHQLLSNDLCIYKLSAPAARANGDNPGTAVGNVTFNQAALLTGTASVYIDTNGYIEVPTSPIVESVSYGVKPRLRIEAEVKLDTPPGGPLVNRYVAMLKSGTLPALKLALWFQESGGVRRLMATVGHSGNTYVVQSAGGLFNVGTAYKIAVELDDTTVRLYQGTTVGNLAEILSSPVSGTPTQMSPSAVQELIFRIGNDAAAGSPLKGNLANVTLTGLPVIVTASLPDGAQGAAYSQHLQAAGGSQVYTWSISAGALPAGLTLSAAGVISGTPTTLESQAFTVLVTDSAGWTDSLALTLNVGPGVPILTSIAPSEGEQNGPTFVLTLTGSAFNAACVARFGGTALATSYLTPTSLSAIVPAGLQTMAGPVAVTVVHPTAGVSAGGQIYTITGESTAPLPPAVCRITGVVYDTQGAPAAGLPYLLEDLQDPEFIHATADVQLETGAAGEVDFTAPRGGTLTLTGAFQAGDVDVTGGVSLAIPDAESADLYTLLTT